MRFKTEKCL